MPNFRTGGCAPIGQKVFDIDGIELVGAIAEVATHFHGAALGQDGADFLGSEGSKHADDTLP